MCSSDLTAAIDAQIDKYNQIVAERVPTYNRMILERGVDVIAVPQRSGVSRK